VGLNASAELIWGIPVVAFDEDTGEPTEFWDAENDDWREFEGEIYVRQYGHYEDPDGPRGILTSTRVETHRGDCWDLICISAFDLDSEANNDKLYSKSEDQARSLGLPISFYAEAGWWLVASYG
jgi:hypothetical protein